LGNGGINIGFRLQEHFNHGDAVIGLRFHMLDVIDRLGHVAFQDAGKAILHVLRRKSRVILDHADHGYIDGGENVHRGLYDGNPAEDQNQKGHYDKRIWSVKSDPYNPHI
jgi:hypothetical protein